MVRPASWKFAAVVFSQALVPCMDAAATAGVHWSNGRYPWPWLPVPDRGYVLRVIWSGSVHTPRYPPAMVRKMIVGSNGVSPVANGPEIDLI